MSMSTATDATYDGILHRKSQGSLVLSDRGLCFRNVGDTAAVAAGGLARVVLPWQQVTKHQVSPASHPKALLKVLAHTPPPASGAAPASSSFTFAFPGRPSLERARRDITARLSRAHAAPGPRAGQKRPRDPGHDAAPATPLPPRHGSAPAPAQCAALEPLVLVATRAFLLAADPALRAQHRLLVLDGVGTLSEGDFWRTHARLVADEHAKICGATDRGKGSGIRSSLDLGRRAPASSTSTTATGPSCCTPRRRPPAWICTAWRPAAPPGRPRSGTPPRSTGARTARCGG